jgi:hypothetical protein
MKESKLGNVRGPQQFCRVSFLFLWIIHCECCLISSVSSYGRLFDP